MVKKSCYTRRLACFAVLFSGLIFTGCQTSGPQFKLVLSNASNVDVSDVEVLLDGKPVYQLAQLEAHENQGNSLLIKGKAPNTSIIRWNSGENSYEKTFKPEKSLPKSFQGHITLEFKAADEVQLFSQAGQAGQDPEMPWSTPEEWEGAPSIPGLTGQ
ncbi:MAG: hypothetical protein ACI9TH_005001 [Kiritimatiellia bacterium]|jgi:hypothetical protein